MDRQAFSICAVMRQLLFVVGSIVFLVAILFTSVAIVDRNIISSLEMRVSILIALFLYAVGLALIAFSRVMYWKHRAKETSRTLERSRFLSQDRLL